jgi:hypothetical protein
MVASVNNHRTIGNPIALDEVRSPDRAHHDIALPYHIWQVVGARMTDGHRGIGL